jgi:uncharacterized membrane protein YfcA
VTTFGGLVLVALIGFVAQLVDGSLGMGFGVTSATLLAATGFTPAAASATIHVVKIGTGLMSGTAHWRFGNVHWRAVIMLATPGFVGAFVGAIVLSNIAGDIAAPWVSLILGMLGVVVLARTVFGRSPAIRLYSPRWRSLGPLGAVGGFVDSIGGGGWGPVTTSTMMAANQLAPNQVIGTVSMSEFIVAVGATLGFMLALGGESIPLGPTIALLLGALVAAPIAAWAVSRLDHHVLGALVGGMILFYNAPNVLGIVGISGDAVIVARLAIVVTTLFIAAYAWRASRSHRSRTVSATTPAPGHDPAGTGGNKAGIGGAKAATGTRTPAAITVEPAPDPMLAAPRAQPATAVPAPVRVSTED